MKLRMAMIFAKDINRMLAFYRDGLGLTPVPDKSGEGWVVFDADGARLALHAVPPAIARNIEITEPPQERSETPIKLVFQTEDLEAVALRLASLGAKVFPPRGSGSRDVVDPEGNIFQLAGHEP
jgi:catechol 2,3-dioxygenase-like lactoylglutathione lyase family enzyme